MLVLDWETEGIDGHRPPAPLGLAFFDTISKERGYLASGHDTGNTHSRKDISDFLSRNNKRPWCFHNAKFDMGVIWTYFPEVITPPASLIHDTLALASLQPQAAFKPSLSLKDLGKSEFGIQTDPQDEMLGELRKKYPREGKNKLMGRLKELDAGIVGRYAINDVELTALLLDRYEGSIETSAYTRYQMLMPILYEMEQRGVALARNSLVQYGDDHLVELHACEDELAAILDIDRASLSSGPKFLRALLDRHLVDEHKLLRTPTGKYSCSADSIEAAVYDSELIALFKHYKALYKERTAFILPWSERCSQSIHSRYNLLRATKTGRMSSSGPNMQQVPPQLRQFLIPDPGQVWVSADYSQQEVRILAHLAEGRMRDQFIKDPDTDIHSWVADVCCIQRKIAKAVNFGIVYGQGVRGLSHKLGCDIETAMQLRQLYFSAFPDVAEYLDYVSDRVEKDPTLPFQTVTGRGVWAEPQRVERQRSIFENTGSKPSPDEPKYVDTGRYYGYKVPNAIIQGTGADMMCDALIKLNDIPKCRLLSTVHDEANLSANLDKKVINEIRDAMMAAAECLSVPMKVDIDVSPSWGGPSE